MRIIVIADTHTNVKRMNGLIESLPTADLIVHLGDGLEDMGDLTLRPPGRYIGVMGNEDRGHAGLDDTPYELTLKIEDIKIFCTHGHLFDLNPYYGGEKWGERLGGLVKRAKHEGASVALFGHTHKAHLEERDGVVLMNPGAIYPEEEWAYIGVITTGEGEGEV